ncbi:MAG TPA: YqaJ viral recombinase family protein [Acidimicrobiia bacterium]
MIVQDVVDAEHGGRGEPEHAQRTAGGVDETLGVPTYHTVDTTGPGRAEWLAIRRTGLGASDIAAILGMSPWSSPYTVWAEKVEGYEREPNEAMAWGKRLEDVIRAQFAEETGLYVGPELMVVRDGGVLPVVFATIDGFVHDDGGDRDDPADGALGVVEIKTDGSFRRWDEVPDHYQIQVQWQLLATGLDMAWVACLHGGRRFEVYEVPADERVQQVVYERATEWWRQHIVDGEPPEIDGSDATTRVLADLYPESSDAEAELDEKAMAAVATLRILKDQEQELKAAITRMENEVKAALGDAGVGVFEGRPVVRWRTVSRKEYVVKASTFRRFELVKEKD